MGIAEIVPGVSGTAIAISLGFYNKIINLVYSFSEIVKGLALFLIRKKSFKEITLMIKKIDYHFAVPLFIGVGFAALLLSGGVLFMFERYPHYLYAILFGLLFAVIIAPVKQMSKIGIKEIGIIIPTFIIFFYILGIEGVVVSDSSPNLIFLFFLGFLAIIGMILPAVSGSFIMLALGGYYFILNLIRDFIHLDISLNQLLSLTVFGIGAISGFVLISQLMKKLLDNHRNELMAFIIGLILASIRVVWPFVVLDGDDLETSIKVVSFNHFSSNQLVLMGVLFIVTVLSVGYFNLKSRYEE